MILNRSDRPAVADRPPFSLTKLEEIAKKYKQIKSTLEDLSHTELGDRILARASADERILGRSIEALLGAQVETITCMLIKARLLDLFCVGRDRMSNAEYPEMVSDAAIQLGAVRIADSIEADCPHAAEVRTAIDSIRLSIICQW